MGRRDRKILLWIKNDFGFAVNGFIVNKSPYYSSKMVELIKKMLLSKLADNNGFYNFHIDFIGVRGELFAKNPFNPLNIELPCKYF